MNTLLKFDVKGTFKTHTYIFTDEKIQILSNDKIKKIIKYEDISCIEIPKIKTIRYGVTTSYYDIPIWFKNKRSGYKISKVNDSNFEKIKQIIKDKNIKIYHNDYAKLILEQMKKENIKGKYNNDNDEDLIEWKLDDNINIILNLNDLYIHFEIKDENGKTICYSEEANIGKTEELIDIIREINNGEIKVVKGKSLSGIKDRVIWK